MIKIKEKSKKDKNYIVVKVGSKDVVNEGEVKILTSAQVNGVLPLLFASKHNSKTFSYDVTDLTSLKMFLNRPQTKESFLKILQNITKVMRNCEAQNMSINKLYLDINHVYIINYETKELCFLYFPIENFENDELSFISSVSANTHSPQGAEIDYFIDFRKYCESLHYFSLPDLERKIQAIADGISDEEKKKSHKSGRFSGKLVFDPFDKNNLKSKNASATYDGTKCYCENCHAEYPLGTKFCPECGENLTPIKGNTESAGDNAVEKEIPVTPTKKRETKLMKSKQVTYPSLLRVNDNSVVYINKQTFSVGYNDDCDYSFQDNELISGHHCVLYFENGNVYIMDEKSTNGTYINDEELPYGKKVMLNFGDKITLADEEFILKGMD